MKKELTHVTTVWVQMPAMYSNCYIDSVHTRPEWVANVELHIDFDSLAKMMAIKGKKTLAFGAIVARIANPAPAITITPKKKAAASSA